MIVRFTLQEKLKIRRLLAMTGAMMSRTLRRAGVIDDEETIIDDYDDPDQANCFIDGAYVRKRYYIRDDRVFSGQADPGVRLRNLPGLWRIAPGGMKRFFKRMKMNKAFESLSD